MKTLKFNNKSYAIDLDKLMKWISSPVEGNDNQLQTSVTEVWAKPEGETYGDDLDLITKEMTDIKSDSSDVSTKFEIMKDILSVVMGINYNPDGSLKSTGKLTLSEALCLNTLITYEIIYEINENEK